MLKFLKKHLPDQDAIAKIYGLQWLANTLKKHPNYWSFNRRAVANGVAAGLFAAFLPLPIQMLLAVFISLVMRGNLAVAAAMTWITNPVTFVPINYLIYKIGGLLTHSPVTVAATPEVSWRFDSMLTFWQSLQQFLLSLGKAFLIGLPIVATTAALLGYLLVRIGWRLAVVLQRRRRRMR